MSKVQYKGIQIERGGGSIIGMSNSRTVKPLNQNDMGEAHHIIMIDNFIDINSKKHY